MPPLILVPSLADQRPTNEVPIGEVARHRRVIARPDTTDDVVVAVQLDFATIVMHDRSPGVPFESTVLHIKCSPTYSRCKSRLVDLVSVPASLS